MSTQDTQIPNERAEKVIAFVLYPGLTIFDLTGPLQVISRLAEMRPEIRPVVVGERIVGLQSDRLAQTRRGVGMPALQYLRAAEQTQGFCMSRRQRKSSNSVPR